MEKVLSLQEDRSIVYKKLDTEIQKYDEQMHKLNSEIMLIQNEFKIIGTSINEILVGIENEEEKTLGESL